VMKTIALSVSLILLPSSAHHGYNAPPGFVVGFAGQLRRRLLQRPFAIGKDAISV
jgi:hypothetical protein